MTRHRMRERRKRHQRQAGWRHLMAGLRAEAAFLNAIYDGATIVTAPGPVADELRAGGVPEHRLSVSRYAPPGYLFAIPPGLIELRENGEPILRNLAMVYNLKP